MKKLALSIAVLCGLGSAAINTASAGDWHGEHRHDRRVPVVKKYDLYDSYYSTPSYGNKWNDGCFPTVIRREPVHVHSHRYDWNDRYDYRRPVGPSKGFGFNTPDVSFWLSR